jgi:hypothetical protein
VGDKGISVAIVSDVPEEQAARVSANNRKIGGRIFSVRSKFDLVMVERLYSSFLYNL